MSLFAAYACAGRSLERHDDDDAGATDGGSLAGRGGAGGSASGRGGFAGTYNSAKGGSQNGGTTGKGGSGGTVLDGGSSGSGGFVRPTGGTFGSSGTSGTMEAGQGGAGESGRGGTNRSGAGPADGGTGGGGGFACKSPRSFDGGYVACASDVPPNFVFREFSEVYNSYLHRPTTGTCPNAYTYEGEPGGEGMAGAAGAGGYGWGDGCTSNVDCGAPNFCAQPPTANYCDDSYGDRVCQRGCVTDDDCGEQQICLCGNLLTLTGLVGACVPASCKTDADCEAGYKCASTFGEAYAISFSCQKPEDECAGRDDCDDEYGGEGGVGSLVGGTECTQGPGHRVCERVRCAYDWGQEP